jgi:hypothetical protein
MPLLLPRRRFGLRILHAFHVLPTDVPSCDILRVHQAPSRPEGPGWSCLPFATLHVDLTQSETDLLGQMSPGTRYEVHRALERDRFRVELISSPDAAALKRFIEFYDRFASARGIHGADGTFLRQLAQRGALLLSRVSWNDSGELACHAYLVDGRRVRLCHSATRRPEGVTTALLGRANRLLHWEDIRFAKSQGLTLFDFGGVALDEGQSHLHGINRFKQGFGGVLVEEYNCLTKRSARGWVTLLLWHGAKRFATWWRRLVSARASAKPSLLDGDDTSTA